MISEPKAAGDAGNRHNLRVRRRTPPCFHAAAAAMLFAACAARAEDAPATLSRPDRPSVSLRAETRDGRTFLSVNDAVAALDGSMTFDEKTRSYDVKLNGRTAV